FTPPGAWPINTAAVAFPASLFTNTSLLRFESSGVGPGVENNVGQPLGVEQPRVVEGPVMTSTIGSIGIAAPGAVLLIVDVFGVLAAFGAVWVPVSLWSITFDPARSRVVPKARP